MTWLKDSPFFILGATIHDNRRQIHSLAEEMALELDEELCQRIRAELTNPRVRVKHEVAWLPKTNPLRIKELFRISEEEPLTLIEIRSVPKISQFNLLASALRTLDTKISRKKIVELITTIDFISTRLFPADILSTLNEERTVSGFPPIESYEEIENQVAERRKECVNEMVRMLDRLPSIKLINVMTDVAEISTIGGSRPANELIDALVDRYELETKRYLDAEATNITKLLEKIRNICIMETNGRKREYAIQPCISQLERVTRNWDMVAQPCQVSTKARGIQHLPSQEIAYAIRSLSVDIFNQYGMLDSVERLMALLSEVFAEVPDVAEKIEKDEETIIDIRNNL